MYLKSWEPKVEGQRLVSRGPLTNRRLGFDAVLVCPCCQHENTAWGSSSFERHPPTPHQAMVEECLTSLAARRDCEKCGTTSIMPAPDKAAVLERAMAEVTTEWVSSKLAEL